MQKERAALPPHRRIARKTRVSIAAKASVDVRTVEAWLDRPRLDRAEHHRIMTAAAEAGVSVDIQGASA